MLLTGRRTGASFHPCAWGRGEIGLEYEYVEQWMKLTHLDNILIATQISYFYFEKKVVHSTCAGTAY